MCNHMLDIEIFSDVAVYFRDNEMSNWDFCYSISGLKLFSHCFSNMYCNRNVGQIDRFRW